jgi:3-phenylpropionate/trans-cinnamate dioxygenase ferredoxin component
MARFVKVATTGEIAPGTGKQVEVEGKLIGLFNVGGTFYAIDDGCTHSGAPLSEGTIENGRVVCPWHGASFDLRTGEALTPPAVEACASYAVRVQGSDVEIAL